MWTLNDLFIAGVRTAYGDRADEVYAAYLRLFAAAPLALRTPNRVFLSHSLPPASRLADFDPAVLERDDADRGRLPAGRRRPLAGLGPRHAPETAAAFLQKVDADLLVTGPHPLRPRLRRPQRPPADPRQPRPTRPPTASSPPTGR